MIPGLLKTAIRAMGAETLENLDEHLAKPTWELTTGRLSIQLALLSHNFHALFKGIKSLQYM